MLVLVNIDLSNANIDLFEQYEAKALAIIEQYGGQLIERLRSTDNRSEIHLLEFPSADALDSFRADPVRAELQDLWIRTRASSSLAEVFRLT